jgi:hypothetical protein
MTRPSPVLDPRVCSRCGCRLGEDGVIIEVSAGAAAYCVPCLDRLADRNRGGWGDREWR